MEGLTTYTPQVIREGLPKDKSKKPKKKVVKKGKKKC